MSFQSISSSTKLISEQVQKLRETVSHGILFLSSSALSTMVCHGIFQKNGVQQDRTKIRSKVTEEGLPWWLRGEESTRQCRVHGLPWLGEIHIHHAPKLLILCPRAWGHQLWAHPAQPWKHAFPEACPLQQGKPAQWEACTPQPESRPQSPQLEASPRGNQDPTQPK